MSMPAQSLPARNIPQDSAVYAPLSEAERRALEDFIFHEAELADESRYDEWEALLTDDAEYCIPAGDGTDDSPFAPSIANDNRSRLATRLRQLRTGTRISQVPVSELSRVITNMRMLRTAADEYEVRANFVLHEYQLQSLNEVIVWPGRVLYRIRHTSEGLRLRGKTVWLVNRSGPLPSLCFLI